MIGRWAKKKALRVLVVTGALLLVAVALCGCETISFYRQAMMGEYQLLADQRSIEKITAAPRTNARLKQQLLLVEQLRKFADAELKLPVDGHYRKYVDLHRPYVVWNVEAAREFSMESKSWWYPLVGRLEYRGYFSEATAMRSAAQLKKKGYEVYVGGATAYSTLGWFKDPVINTFIFQGTGGLAETLFHELAHQRVFARGDEDFNEAFATTVGQEGARRWLRDRGDSWRRLLELVEVEPANRAAVDAALEGWLHAWVAGDRELFETAAAAMAGAEDARETLLRTPAQTITSDLPAGSIAIANLVQAPDYLAPLLTHLLAGVVLVADRSEAAQIVNEHPWLRAVTPRGEIVTAVSYRGGKAADAVLAVQARIREAEEDLDRGRQAALGVATAVERCAAERASLIHERDAMLTRVDALRTAAAEAAGALTAAGEGVQRETLQELEVRQQLDRVSTLSMQAEQLQVDALARERVIVDRDTAATTELGKLEQEIGEAGTSLAVLLKRRQDTELRAALARQRFDDLGRQLERAQHVYRSHGDELAQRRAAEEELAVQPALINEERRRWLEQSAALTAELASLESAELPGDDALAVLEAQLRDDEQRNVTLQVELAHADDACAAAAAERDGAQGEVDRSAAGLREGEQPVDDEADPTEEVDWQKTEREVSRLQRRLDGMGAVNLLAPEEYAQVRDRCDTLGAQLADLEQAAAQLMELRQRLEDEIDSRFRTVFQSVAVNFQEFFGELFEGGRATLRLEAQPEGNPLDDGVEILAQTPGKRLQPLTLLSGGERALTALAFLFALQAVNPSPFYVLDEVDAALDDANVARFNRVLKRLAADQQFLIVTHNHSTMAQAEVLYGVTLAEHGISRIVSVRLQHDALIPVGERSA